MLRRLTLFFGIIALAAVTIEVYVSARSRARWQRIETSAERDLSGGGLQGLLRARALALSGAALAADREALATLALANALLTYEYGLDEAESALTAVRAITGQARASARAQALALASRALVELAAGDPGRAEASALQAVARGQEQAAPLFALGRLRLRAGNANAASRAFQAALLREPEFTEARVALAEVMRERGELERARDLLHSALTRTPDHGRARLLLAELGDAVPGEAPAHETWQATCAREETLSPRVAALCDLVRAEAARRRRDTEAAIDLAERASQRRPGGGLLLGRAAVFLASLGAVDRAAAALEAASRLASPTLASLRWAKLAVELGRGQLVDLPAELPPASSPWAAVLRARAAFASGGMLGLPPANPEVARSDAADDELAAFRVAATEGETPSDAADSDPVLAYVRGLKARLAGRNQLAARLLGQALAKHGDACRAAGEYLAACQALGRSPDASALAWLFRENTQCVNLPGPAAATAARRLHPQLEPRGAPAR